VPIGPPGGIVNFVAAAPSDPQVVYASNDGGGIFRSDDAGSTWRSVNTGLSDLKIQCLAVSPDSSGTVYAGGISGGYKTINGGASWSALGGGFPAALVNAFAIDPLSPGTVYVAGSSGTLTKSTNSGASWNAIGTPTVLAAGPRILAVDPAHPATVLLGTLQGGMFRSADGGATWVASNAGLVTSAGDPSLHVSALAIDPSHSARAYAGTVADGVFVSEDSGANWTVSNDGIGQIALATALAVGPDGTAYLAMQQGLYERPAGAAGWSRLPAGTNFVNTLSVGAGPAPALFLGYGKFPFDTGGFERWDGVVFSVSRIPVLVVTAVAADPFTSGRAVVATTSATFEYLPGVAGGPWTPPYPGAGSSGSTALPPISIFFDPRTPGLLYSGSAARIDRSIDGGATTDTTANVGDPATLPLTIVRCFAVQSGTGQGMYAGTSAGLYQSADGGAWSLGSSDLAQRQIYVLAADPASAATLWAGTDDGVYRSTDGGAHWSHLSGVGGNVRAVLAASGGARRVLAGADAGVFTSADGGTSWAQATGLAATVNALVENSATGALVAGSVVGAFESADGGASWSPASEGLGNPNVVCLGLLGDGTLLAGTNGGSAFERVRTSPREPIARAGAGPVPRSLPPRP
jgi:photosystem II stability/assembly factor-like uncharacterized protein